MSQSHCIYVERRIFFGSGLGVWKMDVPEDQGELSTEDFLSILDTV